MDNEQLQQGRRRAMGVVLGQGLLGGLVAAGFMVVLGSRAGASALLGATIGIVATSLMAFAMLRPGVGESASRVAWSFFSGWVVKVGFTVALLVVAFRSPNVDAVALLAAYVATFLGYAAGAVGTDGHGTKRTLGVAD